MVNSGNRLMLLAALVAARVVVIPLAVLTSQVLVAVMAVLATSSRACLAVKVAKGADSEASKAFLRVAQASVVKRVPVRGR